MWQQRILNFKIVLLLFVYLFYSVGELDEIGLYILMSTFNGVED